MYRSLLGDVAEDLHFLAQVALAQDAASCCSSQGTPWGVQMQGHEARLHAGAHPHRRWTSSSTLHPAFPYRLEQRSLLGIGLGTDEGNFQERLLP